MKMKLQRILVLFISLMIVMSACASEPDETAAEGEGESENGAGGDLVIAALSDAVSLDPTAVNDVPSFDVQYNIYETLVRQNEDMEPQPGLAESWEAIDETTWEFKLQEGVTFHDGSEFNADVVKANVERILDPDVAAPAAYLLEMIEDIEVVDDATIRFITEYPFSSLPAHFSHGVSNMVSKDQIEADYAAMEDGEEPGAIINDNPVGTGYFKFDEWQPGQFVRLVKNEDYWDGEASLDSVTFKVVSEDLTRIAELETGDSHISNPLSPSDVEQIEANEEIDVNQRSSVGLDYLGMNTNMPPFDDVRVRQAISMAIDKQQILDGIYDGFGDIAVGPLSENIAGYDESLEGLEYNLEEAKKLLADAGFEDGFSTTIWTNESRERMDIATNVQAQLSELDIDVDVEIFEWGAYLEKIGEGEHDMFMLGWSNTTGDADLGLYPLFHSDNLGPPGNRTFIDDEELDGLMDEARREMDEGKRHEIYSDVQQKLVEEAPMVYLLHQEYLLGVREEVKDLVQLPTRILYLKDVYIEG